MEVAEQVELIQRGSLLPNNYMAKITKIGDTNCNPELKCEFCKELILLGMPFFSTTLTVDWNPAQDDTVCEKCAKKLE